MKAALLITFISLTLIGNLTAQKSCSSFSYQQKELKNNPELATKIATIQTNSSFQNRLEIDGAGTSSTGPVIIKIPVVVHILYHTADQKITDDIVIKQLET